MAQQQQIRGVTPRPQRPALPYPTPHPDGVSLPAELSGLHELLSEVLSEALGRRSQADESAVRDRATTIAKSQTRRYRGAIGGLSAALIALGTWTVAQVRSYGDARAAAAQAELVAEREAEDAALAAQSTRQLADATSARVDAIERKLDRLIALLEEPEDDTPQRRVR